MLVQLNNSIKGWLAWLIVIAIAVVFIFFGISNYLVENRADAEVARVSGQPISYKEFFNTYQLMLQQHEAFLRQNKLNIAVNEQQIKQQALQALVNEKARLVQAEQQHYAVSEETLQQTLLTTPEFQVEGVFSQQKFDQIAHQYNYSSNALLKQLQDSLLLRQLPAGLYNSSFILESEAEPLYRLQAQTRDISYLLLPVSHSLNAVHPTEKQLQAYYQQHQQQFVTTEQLSLQYIEFTAEDITRNVTVADSEIEEYYAEQQEQYSREEMWQLAHILVAEKDTALQLLQRLQAGEDFVTLAKEYSQDLSSAQQGGLLTLMSADSMPEGFLPIAQQLQQGELQQQPLKTQYGYHLLRLEKHLPAAITPLAELQAVITETLKQQKTSELYAQTRDELLTIAYENSHDLTAVAQQFNLELQTTPLFSREKPQGIANNPQVLQAAFSNEVLLDKNNSEPMQIDDTRLVIIRVDEHIASQQQSFQQVKEQLDTAVALLLAKEKTVLQGEAIVEQLRAGQPISEVAKSLAAELQVEQNLSRQSTTVPMAVREVVFRLPQPEKAPVVEGFSLADGDYAVVQLHNITPAIIGDRDATYAQYKASLANTFATIDYQSYNQAAADALQITTNEDLITSSNTP